MAVPLPPLNLSAPSSAASRLDQSGNVWDMGNGPWNVDFGNSGATGNTGVNPWVMYAIAAGIAWLIFKSRI